MGSRTHSLHSLHKDRELIATITQSRLPNLEMKNGCEHHHVLKTVKGNIRRKPMAKSALQRLSWRIHIEQLTSVARTQADANRALPLSLADAFATTIAPLKTMELRVKY